MRSTAKYWCIAKFRCFLYHDCVWNKWCRYCCNAVSYLIVSSYTDGNGNVHGASKLNKGYSMLLSSSYIICNNNKHSFLFYTSNNIKITMHILINKYTFINHTVSIWQPRLHINHPLLWKRGYNIMQYSELLLLKTLWLS